MSDIDDINSTYLNKLRDAEPEPPKPVARVDIRNGLWDRAQREAIMYGRWISVFNPDLAAAFGIFENPPMPFEYQRILDQRNEALNVFIPLLLAMPGTPSEKFKAMGRPKALTFILGLRSTRIPEEDWDRSVWANFNGASEYSGDGRIKPVYEPATGMEWGSLQELADEIGCSVGTLYNHMRGAPTQPSVQGRVFRYAEVKPVKGSISAMTEDEKEALRQRTREMGFEPNF